MSREQEREIVLYVFVATVYTFQVCHSVSLGQRGGGRFPSDQVGESPAARWGEDEGTWPSAEGDTRGAHLLNTNPRPAASAAGESSPHVVVVRNHGETGSDAAPNSFWTVGDVSTDLKASAPDSEDGYQADLTGIHGVQGKVVGPSVDSGPHFSEWLAMRPLVQCDENVMTFTASGQGLTHLLVDREAASPISLSQLPPYCGYSVRTSWSDLEMMAPYDACYISQENDSYVLPMLWWGNPLKLSCPVQLSSPARSFSPTTPSVFCSPYGMAVQIRGQEQDVPRLGVIVNGGWKPFLSEECAHLVHSRPDELNFFISYGASCIPRGEGLHLQLVLDDQEYILSCPVNPQFHHIPDPVSPAPTTHPPPPPQPPTTERAPQLPHYPNYPYPGLQYPQLPQVYPPGPQPAQPPKPTPGSPPGAQPQSLHPIGPPKLPYSPGEHPVYLFPPYPPPVVEQAISTPTLSLVQGSQSQQVSKLPPGPPQYSSGLYYPHVPFYYPAATPAPTAAATETTTTTTTLLPDTQPNASPANPYYPQYYLQMPYYPAPTAAPVTQAPAPLPPPKQPVVPQHQVSPFYPPGSHSSYYPYGPVSYVKPGLEAQSPYSYPYYPYYHPFYPPNYHPPCPLVPQYPEIQTPVTTKEPFTTASTTTSTTVSTPTQPTTHLPHLQCFMGRMVVFLPFAHPDSLQVQECSIASEQRLPCGPAFVSQPQCLSMGCCFSKQPPACYYPMDECSIDHHFVFSVPASITEPPLSPALLVAASNSTCKPQRVTSDYALFKIPMDGCGARRVVVGKMVIYMVEVINKVQGISLNYGTITRDSPVRFLVECRFQPGSVLSVSYLVKTPTLSPGVQTREMFGVQLRIAKDAQYSNYYPQYHQPLPMLLGKPLYLEVRLLNAPDPSEVLLVHFCVAYPRSGKSVWVLLYNGCPNPLDPAPHQAILSDPRPTSQRGQTRRFTISTFQFLPDGEFKDPNEEDVDVLSLEKKQNNNNNNNNKKKKKRPNGDRAVGRAQEPLFRSVFDLIGLL
ncbi:hypothetical protein F2P81_010369 [Scophthalmus maximus]|uniref:Zona pellucida sperm-binding protein 4-like n=1 Tax=Scophthalmus maximus TaxID=52904 RepID=A0A6A4SXL5_SCOMX|nr:hypothetical protein F2P81_010369 [Scophthalmus maximus]